jgi:hypothetical protein
MAQSLVYECTTANLVNTVLPLLQNTAKNFGSILAERKNDFEKKNEECTMTRTLTHTALQTLQVCSKNAISANEKQRNKSMKKHVFTVDTNQKQPQQKVSKFQKHDVRMPVRPYAPDQVGRSHHESEIYTERKGASLLA